jgi:hypothetical protein
MITDPLGNRTEESVREFLAELDKNDRLGPAAIDGVGFSINSINEVLDCTEDIARQLFSNPSPFLYDEYDQLYVTVCDPETGEKHKLYITSDKNDPDYEKVIEEIGRNLPEVPYDLDCGGYPSRQAEATALYKVSIINALQENYYKDAIDDALKGYDFTRWKGRKGTTVFTNLLQVIQEEADTVSKIVLYCTNTKLVADRVKKSSSYQAILKAADAEKLRLLSAEDAKLNFTFNQKYEKAENIKDKIFIGEELARKRKEMLSQDFVTSEISILFSIYNMNLNMVPGRAKRIIRTAASNYVEKLVEQEAIKSVEAASEFKKKLISRACRLYLSRMKEIRYILWRDRKADTDLSSLIPKY